MVGDARHSFTPWDNEKTAKFLGVSVASLNHIRTNKTVRLYPGPPCYRETKTDGQVGPPRMLYDPAKVILWVQQPHVRERLLELWRKRPDTLGARSMGKVPRFERVLRKFDNKLKEEKNGQNED